MKLGIIKRYVNLFLPVALLIFCFEIIGQKVDTSLIIDEIEISNTRISQARSKLTRDVVVLSRLEIEQLPAQSLAEVLQMIGGVDVRRRGPNGVQADISIRGGSFDQVLILINGVRMNDAQTGHHTLYLPVSLDEVERIEVTKGPAARSYGQNAFSGAINIITKVDGEEKATVSVSHGSFNTTSLYASVSNSMMSNKVKQKFSFQKENSNGYDYNRDYDIYNYFYDSKIDFDQTSKLRFFTGFTERKFGANGFYALPSAIDQYEEVQTSVASAQYQKLLANWSLAPRISWRRNFDYYEFVRGKPQIFKNRTLGNRVTLDFNASNFNKLGVLGIGVEYSKEFLRSIRLGDRDRSILGLNLEQKFELLDQKLLILPGFFINKFSDQKAQFFPGIDASYQVNNGFKIFGNFNVANRIPTYTDLYYTSPSERGNTDLQSESVRGLELGAMLSHRGLTMNVSSYRNATVGLIDWTKTSETDLFWVPRNYAATVIEGLETKLSLDFAQLWSLKNRFNIGVDGSLIRAKSNEDVPTYITRYQFNHLGSQWIMYASKGILNNRISMNVNYRIIDRVSSETSKTTGKELLDAKLLDVSLMAKLGSFQASFLVNNATNVLYKELTNVVMPGRWYQFKLTTAIQTK